MTAPLRSVHFAADPLLEACLSGTATLHAGMAEAAVAKVQQALMELGYVLRDYGPDGVFGRETGEAVAVFNSDIGLAADAVVGSRTMAALDDRIAAERSGQRGDERDRGAYQLLDQRELPVLRIVVRQDIQRGQGEFIGERGHQGSLAAFHVGTQRAAERDLALEPESRFRRQRLQPVEQRPQRRVDGDRPQVGALTRGLHGSLP